MNLKEELELSYMQAKEKEKEMRAKRLESYLRRLPNEFRKQIVRGEPSISLCGSDLNDFLSETKEFLEKNGFKYEVVNNSQAQFFPRPATLNTPKFNKYNLVVSLIDGED